MISSFNPQNCHVALLAGGTSGERKISLASGEGVREALKQEGFPTTVFDPACKEDLKLLIDGNYDVAFICLHGRNGEDGALQGLLEIIGLPYIGSGVWSSALAMDKSKSKIFYDRAGIPTPNSVVVKRNQMWNVRDVVKSVGHHCVVKPACEGSALGVLIVEGEKAIQEAVGQTFLSHEEVLIERYVTGRELTVAVIGNNDPTAFPVIEIVPQGEFYDFESKYAPGGSQHLCPASLSDETAASVQEFAVRAHKALECRGVSRSDFILDEAGGCWILETNTIPGMTKTSLLPDAARAAGMTFSELCTKLIQFALETNQQGEAHSTEFVKSEQLRK